MVVSGHTIFLSSQVSGLGMTGSYQLMDPYMPMPSAIKRIVKNEVWQDDEYSDVEAKESEVEVNDSDDDQPVYKPRGCKISTPSHLLFPIPSSI